MPATFCHQRRAFKVPVEEQPAVSEDFDNWTVIKKFANCNAEISRNETPSSLQVQIKISDRTQVLHQRRSRIAVNDSVEMHVSEGTG